MLKQDDDLPAAPLSPRFRQRIMNSSDDYAALIQLLKERGHSDEEIKLILAKVRQYDERTLHDSVMDSIGAGRMTLDALIKEALED